ncbi:MAG: N-6 DNA methylase [Thiogranum sp.]|nr:N-6 DNA methylase [Thiogranum sp.]
MADSAVLSQNAINQTIEESCDALGGIADAMDYVVAILLLKFLNDAWKSRYAECQDQYKERPDAIEAIMTGSNFDLPAEADFEFLCEHRNEPGNAQRIDRALRAIQEVDGSEISDVLLDIRFNSNKLGPEKQRDDVLKRVLTAFAGSEFNLHRVALHKLDIIENAYDFLVRSLALKLGKKDAHFYTPPEIGELMAGLMSPRDDDDICDPACGSGSLLLECSKYIRLANNHSNHSLYGQEASRPAWALAKLGMILHAENSFSIEWGDALRNPKLLDTEGRLKLFDVIVSVPPFSLNKWGYESARDDPYDRYLRGLPPKSRGDYAFILHMMSTLKPTNGRMGVILPLGALFREGNEAKLRKSFIEDNLLDAVVTLPEKMFYWTSIPTVLLIFKANKTDNDILFIDASREYRRGKNQNQLTDENIAKIVKTYRARVNVNGYAYRATVDDIRENAFNCSVSRYVLVADKNEEIDILALRQERDILKEELRTLEDHMGLLLKKLDYDA